MSQLDIFQTITNRNNSYHQVKINKRQKEILNALGSLKMATNRRIAKYLNWDINRVTGRVNELVKKGEIVVHGSTMDDETNRTVTVFKLSQ